MNRKYLYRFVAMYSGQQIPVDEVFCKILQKKLWCVIVVHNAEGIESTSRQRQSTPKTLILMRGGERSTVPNLVILHPTVWACTRRGEAVSLKGSTRKPYAANAWKLVNRLSCENRTPKIFRNNLTTTAHLL